jgi:hypothetical protein
VSRDTHLRFRQFPALPKAKHASVTQAARSVLAGISRTCRFHAGYPFILHGMETKAASTTVPNGDRPEPALFATGSFLTCRGVKPIAPAVVKGEYTETARGAVPCTSSQRSSPTHAGGPPVFELEGHGCCETTSSTYMSSVRILRSGQHSPASPDSPHAVKTFALLVQRGPFPFPAPFQRELDLNDRLIMSSIRIREQTYLFCERLSLDSPFFPRRENVQKNIHSLFQSSLMELRSLNHPTRCHRRHCIGHFSSCSNSSNVPRNAILPLVAPCCSKHPSPLLHHRLNRPILSICRMDAPYKADTSYIARLRLGSRQRSCSLPSPGFWILSRRSFEHV